MLCWFDLLAGGCLAGWWLAVGWLAGWLTGLLAGKMSFSVAAWPNCIASCIAVFLGLLELAFSMPASLGSADLRKLGATSDEVKQAKELLNKLTDKEFKSKMNSLTAWVKAQGGDAEILSSRGDQRRQWLQNFCIHQSRVRVVKKTAVVSNEISEIKAKMSDVFFWAAEQMDQELGSMKGKAWRESGLLVSMPCPLTKSREPHLLTYVVPQAWERMTSADLENFKTYYESEATKDDEEKMKDARIHMQGFVDDDEQPLVQVKQEHAEKPRSEQEKAAEQLASFSASVKVNIQKFQSIEMTINDIHVARSKTAERTKQYSETLAGDLEKLKKSVRAMISILQRAQTDTPRIEKVPEVQQKMQQLTDNFEELTTWASKLDLHKAPASKRKMKVAAASSSNP